MTAEHTTVLGCHLTLHPHVEPATRRILVLRMDDGRTAEVVLSPEDRAWLRGALAEVPDPDLAADDAMTGPDCYRKALYILGEVDRLQPSTEAAAVAVAGAQVYATLAQVAATIAARVVSPQEVWGGHTVALAEPEDWADIL